MRLRNAVGMLLAAASVGFAAGVHAQAVLTGDTQISSGAPTTVYGASETLAVNATSSALLRFEVLDNLPPGITAGQVAKARLVVFPDRVTMAGPLYLYQVTSAWNESSTTYTSKPTAAAPLVSSQAASTANSPIEFVVTSLVQQWVTQPAGNFGFEIRATGAKTDVSLDSKENTATSHAAMLIIDLTGPVGAKGATGAIGPQGPSGPTGPQGPQGVAGSDATVPANLTAMSQALGTAGYNGNGFRSPVTCTLGDILLSVNSYGGSSMIPADGTLLPINQNQALFSLLGTTFGGNGTTNFALPDMRPFTPQGLQYSICVQGYYPARN